LYFPRNSKSSEERHVIPYLEKKKSTIASLKKSASAAQLSQQNIYTNQNKTSICSRDFAI